MKSGRVMDFEVPEHIQGHVECLRAMRQKRAEEKEKAKKETEVKVKETTTDDFFERIDAEINALLDSVKLEEEKKPIEIYSYEFN